MSSEGHGLKPSFPNPAVVQDKSSEESLDLKNIDVTRQGTQNDAVVSKGPASTFVSKLPSRRNR